MRHALGVLALLVACAIFARAYLVDYWGYDASDLEPIVVGGALLDRGQADHLYDHDKVHFNRIDSWEHERAAHDQGVRSEPRPFVSMPAVAVAARAVTGVRYDVLGRALLIANVIAILAALFLLDRHFRLRIATPLGAAVALLFLHQWEPMRSAAELGQTTPLVLLAIVGALVLDARDRPIGAGLCLAFAIVLKLTPALLIVGFLLRRRWRAAIACGAAVGAAMLVGVIGAGPEATGTWLGRMLELSGQSFPAFNNQSIGAFLLRFERPMPEMFSWKLFELAPAYRLASGAVAGGGIAYAWWLHRRGAPADLIWSVLIVLLLAVPSISWNHYYLYALWPAATILRHRRPGQGALPIVIVVVGLGLMWRGFGLGSNLFAHGNLMNSGCLLGVALLGAALPTLQGER